jgi:hypothetical protein
MVKLLALLSQLRHSALTQIASFDAPLLYRHAVAGFVTAPHVARAAEIKDALRLRRATGNEPPHPAIRTMVRFRSALEVRRDLGKLDLATELAPKFALG